MTLAWPPGRWRAIDVNRAGSVAGGARHVLYVNGVEVARGPARSNPRDLLWDEVDLAPHLVPGVNVVAALACLYAGPVAWWMPPPFLAGDITEGAFVFEARLPGGEWLVSDATWQGLALDGWGADPGDALTGRSRERIDLRSLPEGWLHAGGGKDWPAAITRRAHSMGASGRPEPPSYPGGPLAPRPTPLLAGVPQNLEPLGDGAFSAGRVVAGTLALDLEIPAGVEVRVRTAEFDGADLRPAPGQYDGGVTITGDGTRRTVETLDPLGFRGVVVDAPPEVSVHGVRVLERLHPVTGEAFFECSDDLLNRVYAVGRRTVTITSFDAYVDCPTREQRAWTGDAVVHQMVDLTTNSDWSLARRNPRLAASPRADGMLPMAVAGDVEHLDLTVIPDWALHWVHSVWNLYRYCGDPAEIRPLLQVAEGVVRWFTRFDDGHGCPADIPGWLIIDWASVYTDGVSAAMCGLWGRALLEFAEMADWLGDSGRVAWALDRHARLAKGFERLWDAPRQRYADSLQAGELKPMASQHAQAAAIVGGLAPPERHARLVEVLTGSEDLVHATFSVPDGPALPNSGAAVGGQYLQAGQAPPWWDTSREVVRAQPFFRYVVHDALVKAGWADFIPAQLRDWAWALERCPTSWTECWFGGTVSHGWSSTPTRDLVQRVLGVEPAEPGFGVARIEPALGNLEWARGAAPCPAGLIRVDVDFERLRVDSPVPWVHHGERYEAGLTDVARIVPMRSSSPPA